MGSPKPTKDDLLRMQRKQQLDELEERARARLAKSRRFKARVKKFTGQRLTLDESELLEDEEDDVDLLDGVQLAGG